MKVTSVVLVGPASPRDIAHRLTGGDAERGREIEGYRGVPVTTLAEALLDNGFEVEVVTTAPDIEEYIELVGPRFRLLAAPLRTRARDRALDLFREERRGLSTLLRQTQSQVVHAHWTYEFAWSSVQSGRPVVVTAHDAPLTILRYRSDAYRTIRAVMAWRVRLGISNLTTVSPYLASRWRREMLYPRRIAVVPNIAPFIEGINGNPSPNGVPRIVTVSEAGRRKNVPRLLEAFDFVRKAYPAAELLVIGRGIDQEAVPAGATERAAGIRFAGAQDRGFVLGALRSATVFVHPSLEECCPVAVLEAMAVGVPVVAGEQAGGTPWVLENGLAGVLVDVTTPSRLADGIMQVIGDADFAKAVSRRASRRVARQFSPDAVVDGYSNEYDSVYKQQTRS